MGLQRHVVRRFFEVTLNTSNGVPYTAGDAIGSLQTVPNVFSYPGQVGLVTQVVWIDADAQSNAAQIIFFKESVTGVSDNAAISFSDADAAKTLGHVTVQTANDINLTTNLINTSSPSNSLVPLCVTSVDRSLRFQVRTGSTPTYTSTSGVKLLITVEML